MNKLNTFCKGTVLWLTGLSGSGKTSIALSVQKILAQKGMTVVVLDGDQVRASIARDLGFTKEDRFENTRRIAEIAKLISQSGVCCLVSVISPYRLQRVQAKKIIGPSCFHEVYVKAQLTCCEQRDPKGLYRKARSGKIPRFTGVSDPYEVPSKPHLLIDVETMSLKKSTDHLLDYMRRKKLIKG